MAKKLKTRSKEEFVFEFKKKVIKCRSCGKTFEVKPTARFQRKYCVDCSKANKDYYDNLDSVTVEDCED